MREPQPRASHGRSSLADAGAGSAGAESTEVERDDDAARREMAALLQRQRVALDRIDRAVTAEGRAGRPGAPAPR